MRTKQTHWVHSQLSGSLKADDEYGCPLGAAVCGLQTPHNIPPTANCSRAKTDTSVPDDRFMTPADLGQTMTAKDERNRHELNRANHPDLEINDIRGLPYGCTYRASFPANWSWM